MTSLAPVNRIEQRIFLIRGQRVMIDRDLARLYGVPTKQLNRQVKRNPGRFPPEFMFQLTRKERDELVPNWHRFESMKHSSIAPYAFTEHGVAMLASVLNGERAVRISVAIIQTFVKLRRIMASHREFSRKLAELESRVGGHDEEIRSILRAIRSLTALPENPKPRIGFQP